MLQRRITGYHEAAHAAMAFRLGVPVDELRICDAGPLAGYVSIRGAPLLVAAVNSPGDAPPWPTVVRDTERQVMVLLAGPLAEARLLGERAAAAAARSRRTGERAAAQDGSYSGAPRGLARRGRAGG